ncbi:piggyBac transposable element-derived protein 4-like [Vespa crabro]|uniref:piggyBac transposable element-derived protein 4-like n=1 Tax=Vespa crabro TaxID=7445 RepID=UPI001F022441|nr:piggyBac transposable element-derived protein 4-like [Vespa crabro]
MSKSDDEIYADNLSNVSAPESNDSEDSDSGSEIFVRKLKNLMKPVIDSDEEDSSTSDEEEMEWTRTNGTGNMQNCKEQAGVQISLDEWSIQSAVDLFFGEEYLMKLFVTETNLYHKRQQIDIEESKDRNWTDTDAEEIKKFFALIILMGLVKKSEKNEYWSISPLIFGRVTPRIRFHQIWKYWHFNDNEKCQDRLNKIKPMTDHFKHKFRTVYKLTKELSLDEAIIPWRGKLCFRTYNPDKIVKYGILVRMLCEARSGYICNFDIYYARGIKLKETILSVLSPYLYLWHDIYMDNYYNSVAITEELLQKQTNVCGTLRKHRGVLHCLKNINLKESGTDFCRKANILVQAFRTKKKDIIYDFKYTYGKYG